ncbi:hypothetical protein [Bdellovibrio bacteriovorus]|uniref:hypothetical protein n=1 Tax=Bdellovibrio bacteriovorus TaxID=959 RepID=UPI0012DA1FF3|nr:hypothetical protein [Bdellovibrio bacteriovorus]
MDFLLKGALLIGCGWLLLTSLGYLFTPLIFDHAEANIASVGALYGKGLEIYTELSAPSRYSLLYGPWPYLVVAFFQSLISNMILAAKLPGVINLFLLVGCTYILSTKIKGSAFQKLLSICVIPLALLGYYNFSYWNRPDSYIMANLFCAFTVVSFAPRISFWGTSLLVGLLAGLAANSKLHACLYFVPVAVYFFETYRFRRYWTKILLAAIAFLCALVMPFLLPNIGAENYLLWLQMASKHGLVLEIFLKNISFVASFLLFLYFSRFNEKFKLSFIALCVVSFLVAVVASKPGAGQHHFLPFVPLILWLAIQQYFSMDSLGRSRFHLFAAAFLLTLAINGVNRQKQIAKFLAQTSVREREFSDLLNLATSLPGNVELGFAGNKTYESTFYKSALIGRNKGMLLDGAALMDMAASGISIPDSTIAEIKSCRSYFVFPKGEEPWSILSFYTEKPLFDDQFKSAFKSAYVFERNTEFFAVYKCR